MLKANRHLTSLSIHCKLDVANIVLIRQGLHANTSLRFFDPGDIVVTDNNDDSAEAAARPSSASTQMTDHPGAASPAADRLSSPRAPMVQVVARCLPLTPGVGLYFLTLAMVPLVGSFITEPAAMTLAALLLKRKIFSQTSNIKLMYLTIGVLFVNVSIGGALTNFAAPPILIVANTWGWDTAFVFQTFGIQASIVVLINALLVTLLMHKYLPKENIDKATDVMPMAVIFVHLIFLIAIVVFAHHPVVFMGLLLFFMGYTHAYSKFQNPLLLKEALMVAFFLAGLVVLGGMQQWWLQPALEKMNSTVVYYGAIALTAITDNAALTYLASLVQGTSDEFKYAIVAGAITGGGLTVIANAPNPAGISILREHFPDGSVSALWLFLAALPPTIIAVLAFQVIK